MRATWRRGDAAAVPCVCVLQSQPEALRDRLEAVLGGAGIAYSYTSASKFKNFINKTLE